MECLASVGMWPRWSFGEMCRSSLAKSVARRERLGGNCNGTEGNNCKRDGFGMGRLFQ